MKLHTIAALAAAAMLYAAPSARAQRLTSLETARPDVQVIAMSTFVEGNCIGLHVNKPAVRAVFERSGGFPGWTENPFHQTLVRGEVEALRGDVPRSCAVLWALYGDLGAVQPGVLEADPGPRAGPIPPPPIPLVPGK